MNTRDIAYKKELLVLKGELLRLKLRNEMNQSRGSLGVVSAGFRALTSGTKGRILVNMLSSVVPNQRVRTILKTTLRTVLVWQVVRKYWSSR